MTGRLRALAERIEAGARFACETGRGDLLRAAAELRAEAAAVPNAYLDGLAQLATALRPDQQGEKP